MAETKRIIILDTDKDCPLNMPTWRKVATSSILCLASMTITMISSIWSLASEHLMERFDVGREVIVLGVSLFVWGLAVGPLFLSPISEYYGRKVVFVGSLLLAFAFQFLTSFSPNFGGMLFGRFMTGFFGSAYLSVAPGALSDIYTKDKIGMPLMLYTLSPFVGPGIGPLISGFINVNLNFRWTFYIPLILTGVETVALAFFVPETYRPVLAKYKAIQLRKSTGDEEWFADIEKAETSFLNAVIFSARRPLELLFRDVMVFVLCFYSGLALGIVYLFFVSIPFIFSTVYGFELQYQGLAFVPLILGMLIVAPTGILSQYVTNRLTARNGGVPLPEFRLPPLMVGSIIIPTGLFIMAWTAYSRCHWIGPMIGSAVFASGTLIVFSGIFAYLVDGYRLYAASAMAANSFLRCIMAGVFPLFAFQMYEGIGVHWATSVLAFASIVLIPFPYLFYRYGAFLRRTSPFAWSD